MNDDLELPLSMVRPGDIRGLKEPGVLLPVQTKDPLVAITIWDGKPHAIMLSGSHAFSFFPIDAHSRFFGIFVPAPEIVASTASAVRAQSVWNHPGVLVLKNGFVNVQAGRAGDRLSLEPVEVPLWQAIDCGDADTVAFTRWSLRVTDGTERHTLWRSSDESHDHG